MRVRPELSSFEKKFDKASDYSSRVNDITVIAVKQQTQESVPLRDFLSKCS